MRGSSRRPASAWTATSGRRRKAPSRSSRSRRSSRPTGIVDADTWKALGPLVMEEEPAPEPAVVNAEKNQKSARRCARWAAVSSRAKPGRSSTATTGEFLAGDHRGRETRPGQHDQNDDGLSRDATLAEKDPKVLDEIVTFSERADKTSGSTSDVKAGEKLPVGELLYGLMLPSGNDASVAFAEHFGERLADETDKDGEAEQSRQFHRGDESQGGGDRHEVDALQQPARLAERRTSDDGPRSGTAGVRRVPAAGVQESGRHAAARVHGRFGHRLQAQHRVEEHQPIVEDRRIRRYKDRHDRRGRQLHGFDRRARRATVDHRRCWGRLRPKVAMRTRATCIAGRGRIW